MGKIWFAILTFLEDQGFGWYPFVQWMMGIAHRLSFVGVKRETSIWKNVWDTGLSVDGVGVGPAAKLKEMGGGVEFLPGPRLLQKGFASIQGYW